MYNNSLGVSNCSLEIIFVFYLGLHSPVCLPDYVYCRRRYRLAVTWLRHNYQPYSKYRSYWLSTISHLMIFPFCQFKFVGTYTTLDLVGSLYLWANWQLLDSQSCTLLLDTDHLFTVSFINVLCCQCWQLVAAHRPIWSGTQGVRPGQRPNPPPCSLFQCNLPFWKLSSGLPWAELLQKLRFQLVRNLD